MTDTQGMVLGSDAEKLCAVLSASFSSEQGKRVQAEVHLQAIAASRGLPATLLTVIRSSQVDLDIRLAASILLKNEIRRYWEPPPPEYGVSATDAAAASANALIYCEEDKQTVRGALFDTLVEVCELTAVRNMVEESLKYVALADYPEQWPNILEVVVANLSNFEQVDERRVFASLLALRRLTGKYELKVSNNRDDLNHLIEMTFPSVLRLAECLVRPDADGVPEWAGKKGKALMMKLILAIYWSSTQMALARGGEIRRSLDQYMTLVESVIMTPLPPAVIASAGSEEDEAISHLEQFKAKKRAMQIAHRFFSRHGSSSGDDEEFASRFVKNWAKRFLEDFIQLLRNQGQVQWYATSRMRSLILQYLSQATEISVTYKALKPCCKEILVNHCFPTICYSAADEETWEFDPMDYVRAQSDFACTFADPRESSIELMQTLARLRGKDFLSVLQDIAFVVLNDYNNDPSVPKSELCVKRKYGALTLLGSIANRLAAEKRKNPVGKFLVDHVFPEFTSPHKFLRMKACWTTEQFMDPRDLTSAFLSTSRKFPPPVFSTDAELVGAFKAILGLCSDPELPVRMQAGSSIKCFFEASSEYDSPALATTIRESLNELIRKLFELIAELESDPVVETLQSLVQHFEDEVRPFAAQLAAALADPMLRLLGSEEVAEAAAECGVVAAAKSGDGGAFGEESEAVTTGMSIAETLICILASNNGSALKDPRTATELAQTLYPVLNLMLHPTNPDFMEEGIRMLSCMTAYSPQLDPPMWAIFERLHSAVCGGPATPPTELAEVFKHGWAPDYLDQMLTPLHNYLMKAPEVIVGTKSAVSNLTFIEMLLEMATKGLTDNGDPNGPRHGLELLKHVFVAYLGTNSIDVFMEPAFQAQWNFIKTEERRAAGAKSLIGGLWCSMMLYNCPLFISMIQKAGILTEVMTALLDSLSFIRTVAGKKTSILALGEVINFISGHPNDCPKLLQDELQTLFAKLAQEELELLKLREKSTDESSDESDTESSEEDLSEDDDAAPEKPRKLFGKLHAIDDEEDDDDDYESESESELLVPSKLDGVEDEAFFETFVAKHRDAFATAVGAESFQFMLESVKTSAERRREALASATTTAD